MEKLQRASIIGIQHKNLDKSPSPPKLLSLVDKDLKSTLNPLATKIKVALASKIKQ